MVWKAHTHGGIFYIFDLSGSLPAFQVAGKHTLVLVRHGESTWNLENKFTGWYDCPLSPKGHKEVMEAGQLLKAAGIKADVAHTSLLKRAIRTLWHVLEQSDRMWIPVQKAWQLNERHYGALQVSFEKDWNRGCSMLNSNLICMFALFCSGT